MKSPGSPGLFYACRLFNLGGMAAQDDGVRSLLLQDDGVRSLLLRFGVEFDKLLLWLDHLE